MKHSISKILSPVLAGMLGLVLLSLSGTSTAATSDEQKAALSEELTTLYRSARAVISKNQKHINDAEIGDKGLSGDAVIAKAKENYAKAAGQPFVLEDAATPKGADQTAMLAAIDAVMNEAQALINEQGKGFKGFLPAIFARSVAVKFTENMDGRMSIKLTAPKSYVRNRKNRPDQWESTVIEDKFKAADYEKGVPFYEVAEAKGEKVFRYILPEYYGESCLGCHGGPKGERDITDGMKEGGVLGELGGAISLVISD